jgi:hypothetical protein
VHVRADQPLQFLLAASERSTLQSTDAPHYTRIEIRRLSLSRIPEWPLSDFG